MKNVRFNTSENIKDYVHVMYTSDLGYCINFGINPTGEYQLILKLENYYNGDKLEVFEHTWYQTGDIEHIIRLPLENSNLKWKLLDRDSYSRKLPSWSMDIVRKTLYEGIVEDIRENLKPAKITNTDNDLCKHICERLGHGSSELYEESSYNFYVKDNQVYAELKEGI